MVLLPPLPLYLLLLPPQPLLLLLQSFVHRTHHAMASFTPPSIRHPGWVTRQQRHTCVFHGARRWFWRAMRSCTGRGKRKTPTQQMSPPLLHFLSSDHQIIRSSDHPKDTCSGPPQASRIRTTCICDALHVTLACVHVRAVPSTFDKYLRASHIAVPAAAFVSPPPLPFVANTTAWPCALTVNPVDCDTARVSMPTVILETQLFSPVQQVGHAPASYSVCTRGGPTAQLLFIVYSHVPRTTACLNGNLLLCLQYL